MKTETGKTGKELEETFQTRLCFVGSRRTFEELVSECAGNELKYGCMPRMYDGKSGDKILCLTQYNLDPAWVCWVVDPGEVYKGFWCKPCLEKLTGEKFE